MAHFFSIVPGMSLVIKYKERWMFARCIRLLHACTTMWYLYMFGMCVRLHVCCAPKPQRYQLGTRHSILVLYYPLSLHNSTLSFVFFLFIPFLSFFSWSMFKFSCAIIFLFSRLSPFLLIIPLYLHLSPLSLSLPVFFSVPCLVSPLIISYLQFFSPKLKWNFSTSTEVYLSSFFTIGFY